MYVIYKYKINVIFQALWPPIATVHLNILSLEFTPPRLDLDLRVTPAISTATPKIPLHFLLNKLSSTHCHVKCASTQKHFHFQ